MLQNYMYTVMGRMLSTLSPPRTKSGCYMFLLILVHHKCFPNLRVGGHAIERASRTYYTKRCFVRFRECALFLVFKSRYWHISLTFLSSVAL